MRSGTCVGRMVVYVESKRNANRAMWLERRVSNHRRTKRQGCKVEQQLDTATSLAFYHIDRIHFQNIETEHDDGSNYCSWRG